MDNINNTCSEYDRREYNISDAIIECREAWQRFFRINGLDEETIKFADGDPIWGWGINHDEECGVLASPVSVLISNISTKRSKNDQVVIFPNFRPMSADSNSRHKIIISERDSKLDPIRLACEAEVSPIEAERKAKIAAIHSSYELRKDPVLREEYYSKRGPIDFEYRVRIGHIKSKYLEKVVFIDSEYRAKIAPLHLADVPGHTWSGYTFLPARS